MELNAVLNLNMGLRESIGNIEPEPTDEYWAGGGAGVSRALMAKIHHHYEKRHWIYSMLQ